MRRSRLTRSIWAATLAILGAAALTITACGGSGATASDSPSGAPGQAASSPSATPTSVATALPAPTVAGTIAFGKMVKAAKGYNSEIFTVRTDGTGLKQGRDCPAANPPRSCHRSYPVGVAVLV